MQFLFLFPFSLYLPSRFPVYDLCSPLSLSFSLWGGIAAFKRRNNDKSVSAEEEKEFLVVAGGPDSNLLPSKEKGDIIVSLRLSFSSILCLIGSGWATRSIGVKGVTGNRAELEAEVHLAEAVDGNVWWDVK